MKHKVLKALFSIINMAAIVAIMTPSFFGHYEKQCPEKLKKYQKK